MPDDNFESRKDDSRVGFFTTKSNDMTSVDQVNYRDFINKCTPSEVDLNNIPKLYLQLFSKDANPNKFFSGFITKQISSFKKAISKKNLCRSSSLDSLHYIHR